MAATINDIADECQVSKATVSRYLNRSGYVSQKVAQRIAAKIEELNYVPSAMARSLSTNNSNVIGVVIPEISNSFFAEIFKGISETAEGQNLNILFCDTDNQADKEMKALKMLRTYHIKGIIITPVSVGLTKDSLYNKQFIEHITHLNVPVVLLDRGSEFNQWDGIFTDNVNGAYECTKLLTQNGHTKIGTITGNLGLLIARERLSGYKKAIVDSGMVVDDRLIYEGDFSTEKAYELTKAIMRSEEHPTALFSPNNLTTIGVLKALIEDNYQIPRDISIVGFDDIELLRTLNINLSVAQRDPIAMGRQVMSLLLDRIAQSDKKEGTRRIIIQPKLISRGSEKYDPDP
ncbi:MAG: LacI family transcriptional regulator [Clostridia bacterium]|nr:LacI family transcriptional regulator [Clostridia bacterium]